MARSRLGTGVDAPRNWSGAAVSRLVTELLEQTRDALGVWRAVGEPFETRVCLRADGWEISSRAPEGHVQTFFRQSEDEAASLMVVCITNELHYADLDRQAVRDFADRANFRYGATGAD